AQVELLGRGEVAVPFRLAREREGDGQLSGGLEPLLQPAYFWARALAMLDQPHIDGGAGEHRGPPDLLGGPGRQRQGDEEREGNGHFGRARIERAGDERGEQQ